MKGLPEERTTVWLQYMIEQKATVRQTAARFGISKSTVHKDITTRLQKLNTELYERVQTVSAGEQAGAAHTRRQSNTGEIPRRSGAATR